MRILVSADGHPRQMTRAAQDALPAALQYPLRVLRSLLRLFVSAKSGLGGAAALAGVLLCTGCGASSSLGTSSGVSTPAPVTAAAVGGAYGKFMSDWRQACSSSDGAILCKDSGTARDLCTAVFSVFPGLRVVQGGASPLSRLDNDAVGLTCVAADSESTTTASLDIVMRPDSLSNPDLEDCSGYPASSCVKGTEGIVLSTDDGSADQRQFSSQRHSFIATTKPPGMLSVDAAFGVALNAFGLDSHGNKLTGSDAATTTQPSTSTLPAGSTSSPTVTPDCPDVDTLNMALAAFGDEGTIVHPPLCSGPWAVGFPDGDSGGHKYQYTALFKFHDEQWTEVDRTGPCDNNEVPADIYQPACRSN